MVDLHKPTMAARVRVPNGNTWFLFVLLLQYCNWSIALAKATTNPTTTTSTTRVPWNGQAKSTPTSTRTHPWNWRGGAQEDNTEGGSTSSADSSTTLDAIDDADLDKYIDFILASVKDELDEAQNPLLTLVQNESLSDMMETSNDVEVDSSLVNTTMEPLPETVEDMAVVPEEKALLPNNPEVKSEISIATEDNVTLGDTSNEALAAFLAEDTETVPPVVNLTSEEEEEAMSSINSDAVDVQQAPMDTNDTLAPSDDVVDLDWLDSALETPAPGDPETMSTTATGNARMVCEGTVCRLVPDGDVETADVDDGLLSPPLDTKEELPFEQATVEGESVLEESTIVDDVPEEGQQEGARVPQDMEQQVVAEEEMIQESITIQGEDINASATMQQDGQLTTETLNTTERDILNPNQTESVETNNDMPKVSFWRGARRSWGLMTAGALGIPTENLTLDSAKRHNDTIPIDSGRGIEGENCSRCESTEQGTAGVHVEAEANVSIVVEVKTELVEEVSNGILPGASAENATGADETFLESSFETDTAMDLEPVEDIDIPTDDECESLDDCSFSDDDDDNDEEEETAEMTNISPSTSSFVYRFLLSQRLYRLAMFLALCDEWTRVYVLPCVDSSPLNACLELEILTSKLSHFAIRGGASASPVVQAVPKVAPAYESILEAPVQNNTHSPEVSNTASMEKVRPNFIYRYLLGFEPYGHVAVMESVLLHEWTRVYIPMFESAISTLYHRFFPDASRRGDYDDFGDSEISGFVSADGKAARGGKRRRELAKKADQSSLYQLQSLGDLSVARFKLVSKSFLERHGLGEGQISEDEIPRKNSSSKSTVTRSSSRTSSKPKTGIEITFGLKSPSSDDTPARRTRRKRREKESDSIMTRIRSATEGNFVRSSILGAYPGDARRVSDAASSSGLYDLAKKYGYEDSGIEESGTLGVSGSSRRKTSSQRRKKQASTDSLKTTPRRKRTTKSSRADSDDWDKSVASAGAKRLESSLPRRSKQPDTSVLGKTSSVLKTGRIEVEKRSKDRKK